MKGRTGTRQLDEELSAHPFLFGMTSQDVGLLADCAVRTHFDPGEVIFREGEDANRLYLVETGSVALESRNGDTAVLVETIGAGELLGLSWLFPPHKWRATARVIEEISAVFFHGDVLRKYAERDRSLGYQLYKRFTEVQTRRLESMRRRVVDCAVSSAACE